MMDDNRGSVLRTVTFSLSLAWLTIIFSYLVFWLGQWCPTPKWPKRCVRIWARLLLAAAGVKVRVRGAENLEPGRSYVFASNHQSEFDIFVLEAALPGTFAFIAKKELFDIPLFGAGLRAAGNIPIVREDRRQAIRSLREAMTLMGRGSSVLVFPEGTRSEDGVLREFKKGAFVLALQSKTPVVPVSITGTYNIKPKTGGRLIVPGTVEMIIGEPIPTTGMAYKERELLTSRVRGAIRQKLPPAQRGEE